MTIKQLTRAREKAWRRWMMAKPDDNARCRAEYYRINDEFIKLTKG